MKKVDNIIWLQKWYSNQIDGEWEHFYGVLIETLDNPGWHVKINLQDIDIGRDEMQEHRQYITEYDWIRCSVENHVFEGYGDPFKLDMIIQLFRDWIEET